MWYEPVKHKMTFSAVRARDNRKIYDEYEKICVKSGLYSEDSKANYTLVRIDKNRSLRIYLFVFRAWRTSKQNAMKLQ